MTINESELKDGQKYDILDKGQERYPSAKWCAAYRIFVQEWTSWRGQTVEKRIPIEEVGYISEFEDVPL